jgi:hypothetical protein
MFDKDLVLSILTQIDDALEKIASRAARIRSADDFTGFPVPVKGLRALATEALGRLGVESTPRRFEEAYNSGKATQVPAGRVVAVRRRVRRRLGYNGLFLSFERWKGQ